MPFRIGDVVDDKFRIEGVLGAGGMGKVFAARHLGLDKDVALKVLAVAADPGVKARFLREARAVAKLESDAVAQVFDVGTTRRGVHYIVMERLRGSDLGAVVNTRGPLPPDEAVEMILEACKPLAEAHAAGIIHRDLKPQNLFLAETRSGKKVKLLDFGVSRLASGEDTLTSNEQILGTPRFMPPEQLAGAHHADARSDVYSAGACLFVLLTAAAPITADTLGGLLQAIRTKIPPRADELRSEIPAAIADVVAKCLEKDPARRYASITELAEALRSSLPAGPPPTRRAVEHIDDEAILALQEGRLAGPAVRRWQVHLAECKECRELVGAAAESSGPGSDTLVDPVRGDATDAPVAHRPSPRTIPLPGAAADAAPSIIAAAAPPTLQSPSPNAVGNTFATLVSGEKATARTARSHDTRTRGRRNWMVPAGAAAVIGTAVVVTFATHHRSSDEPLPTSASAAAETMSVAPTAAPASSAPSPSVAASAPTVAAPSSSSKARARSSHSASSVRAAPQPLPTPAIDPGIPNER